MKNPQDITLRNSQAVNKKIAAQHVKFLALVKRVAALEKLMKKFGLS